MIRKESIIRFHLYSVDPEFKIPNINEFGMENNRLNDAMTSTWVEEVIKIMDSTNLTWYYDPSESIRCPFMSRMTFYDSKDNANFQFVVSFLIDTNPCPQKDIKLCEQERNKLARNDGTGQIWFIHHITLSNGEIIECNDQLTCEVNNQILSCIKDDLIKFKMSMI